MAALALLAFAAAAAFASPATAGEPTRAQARAPRAIKPPPAVPEQLAARALATVPLRNASFEANAAGEPDGWTTVQHSGPKSYAFDVDTAVRRSGERSLRVTNVGPEPFGAAYQTVDAAAYRGRTLRLSAWLRTDATTGNRFGSGAGLKLHSVRGGHPLAIARMLRDAVHGTTDWTRYEIVLKVPEEAQAIEAGVVLFGPGTVWMDDIALDVVADAAQHAGGVPAGDAQ